VSAYPPPRFRVASWLLRMPLESPRQASWRHSNIAPSSGRDRGHLVCGEIPMSTPLSVSWIVGGWRFAHWIPAAFTAESVTPHLPHPQYRFRYGRDKSCARSSSKSGNRLMKSWNALRLAPPRAKSQMHLFAAAIGQHDDSIGGTTYPPPVPIHCARRRSSVCQRARAD